MRRALRATHRRRTRASASSSSRTSPYELLPPGTPASELRPLLRLLVPPRLGTAGQPVDARRSGRGRRSRPRSSSRSDMLERDKVEDRLDPPRQRPRDGARRRARARATVDAHPPEHDRAAGRSRSRRRATRACSSAGSSTRTPFAAPGPERARRAGDERRRTASDRAARRSGALLLPRARRARALRRAARAHRRRGEAHVSRESSRSVAAAARRLSRLPRARGRARLLARRRRPLARRAPRRRRPLPRRARGARLWTPDALVPFGVARSAARGRRRHRLPARRSARCGCASLDDPVVSDPEARVKRERGAGSPRGRSWPHDADAGAGRARPSLLGVLGLARSCTETQEREAAPVEHASRAFSGDRPRSRRTTRRSTTSSSPYQRGRGLELTEAGRRHEPAARAAAARRAPARASPAAATSDGDSSLVFLTPLAALARARRAPAARRALLPCAGARERMRGAPRARRARAARARRHARRPPRGRRARRARGGAAGRRAHETRTCAPTPRRSSSSTSRARCSLAGRGAAPSASSARRRSPSRFARRSRGPRSGSPRSRIATLPHLFPSVDQDVFEATLERSLGIEQPPPRSSFAHERDQPRRARGHPHASASSRRRRRSASLVVLTDGETQPVSGARLAALFAPAARRSRPSSCTSGTPTSASSPRDAPEPQYRPDPRARVAARRARRGRSAARVRGEDSHGRDRGRPREPPRRRPDGRARRAGSRTRSRSRRTSRGRARCRSRSAALAPAIGEAALRRRRRRRLVREPGRHGLGEAVLVHVRDRPARDPHERLGARLARARSRTASSPCSGPTAARPARAAGAGRAQRRAVDVGPVLLVPLDADRLLERGRRRP